MAKYALVCGMNNYCKGSFRPLRFGLNDAVRMKGVLELCGYAAQLVPGEKLTYSKLVHELVAMTSKACSGDTLLFYFSGHGCSHGKEQYVLPYDSGFASKEITNGLPVSKLAELTDKSGVERLFIIDACRDLSSSKRGSGDVAGNLSRKGITDDMEKQAGQAPYRVLVSCSDSECSYESSELQGGVFTSLLVEHIIDFVDSGKKVTLFNCVDGVSDRIETLHDRIREGIPVQSPWVEGANLEIAAGNKNGHVRSSFLFAHRNVGEEFIPCQTCGEFTHFLDMIMCQGCLEEFCPNDFGSHEFFCRECAHGIQSSGYDRKYYVHYFKQLREALNFLHESHRLACRGEADAEFQSEQDKSDYIDVFYDNLIQYILRKYKIKGEFDVIVHGVLLSSHFGVDKNELRRVFKNKRVFTEQDAAALFSKCELSLRRKLVGRDSVSTDLLQSNARLGFV